MKKKKTLKEAFHENCFGTYLGFCVKKMITSTLTCVTVVFFLTDAKKTRFFLKKEKGTLVL